MIANIKLAITIVQFILQLLKWMEKSEHPNKKIEKFKSFKNALKQAEKGNPDELEDMFASMRPIRK